VGRRRVAPPGVDASTAYDEQKVGVADEDQLAQAAALGAVIFTHDPDLIGIATAINRRGDDHYGVIFVDMHRLRLGECIRRLALYAEVVTAEDMVESSSCEI
jgi:hypothetical protein